jgi:hypothetical protein
MEKSLIEYSNLYGFDENSKKIFNQIREDYIKDVKKYDYTINEILRYYIFQFNIENFDIDIKYEQAVYILKKSLFLSLYSKDYTIQMNNYNELFSSLIIKDPKNNQTKTKQKVFNFLKDILKNKDHSMRAFNFYDIQEYQQKKVNNIDFPEINSKLFNYKLYGDVYIWKSNEVFVDFAAESIGGGVIGDRGWVQEEFSTAGLSLLPFIGNLKKMDKFTNLSVNPSIIYTIAYFTPNNTYYGGSLSKVITEEDKFNPFNETEPLTIPIYWLTLTGIDLKYYVNPDKYKTNINAILHHDYVKQIAQPYSLYSNMVLRARKAYYLTIWIQYLLGKKEIIINTGNWAAGDFKWDSKVSHTIQLNSINFVYNNLKSDISDLNIKYIYHSFDQKGKEKIEKIRDTWGSPDKQPDFTSYLQDTVYFNKPDSIYIQFYDKKDFYVHSYYFIDFANTTYIGKRYTNPRTHIQEMEYIPIAFNPSFIVGENNPYAKKFNQITVYSTETFFQIMKLFIDLDKNYTNNIHIIERCLELDLYPIGDPGVPEIDVGSLKKYTNEGFKNQSEDQKKDWFEIKRFKTMLYAIRVKFSIPHLKELLLSTSDMYIVEETSTRGARDAEWGSGSDPKNIYLIPMVIEDGKGYNYLGQILMHVRKEIRLGKQLSLLLYKSPKDFFGMEMVENGLIDKIKLEYEPISIDFFYIL